MLYTKWIHKFLLLLKKNMGGSRIFLGGGALVSCSTSTPINHIVFFFFCRIPVVLDNRRSSQGGGGRGAHPLHPPLKKDINYSFPNLSLSVVNGIIEKYSIGIYRIRDIFTTKIFGIWGSRPPIYKRGFMI